MVITRFAPSPTGSLHIGSVRTVLFNYLYAKRFNGKFRLRIEDTDKERSQAQWVENILNTLKLLDLKVDDEIVFQSDRCKRHQEVAHDLLKHGKAYRCYCTVEELEQERENAMKESRTPGYNRKCRELKETLEKPFVVRLKAPLIGRTEFEDQIQGKCGVDNEHMDDMVLLRSDGTPTYMLAVVVDDHDMEVTHVIRGSEHLNNAYRQILIYNACDWKAPNFAHVSLIAAENGQKLSKRLGAKSVEEYLQEGFYKEAILNYLLLLGWTHPEGKEIFTFNSCYSIFDIKDVRSSIARFSMVKLLDVNATYLRAKKNTELLADLKKFATKTYSDQGWKRVLEGMDSLKERSRTLAELASMADIYGYDDDFFEKIEPTEFLKEFVLKKEWQEPIDLWFKQLLVENHLKLRDVAMQLRLALTKSTVAPSIFEIIEILGKDLFYKRLENALSY